MSYSIKHEGAYQFVVYFKEGPDEIIPIEEFKTNSSAIKFIHEKENEDEFKRMVDEVPEKIRFLGHRTATAWQKAMRSNSRKNAIRAFCLECVGGDGREVAACSAKDCSLWKFRLKG